MPRRIDIELTSARDDGSFTWRAAGARNPKGVLDGAIVPSGSSVGDELKVEIEQMLDGIEVLSVVKGRDKPDRDLLELLPSDKPFEAVIETRAKRDRGGGRDQRGRGDKRGGGRRDDRPGGKRNDGERGDGRRGDDKRGDGRRGDDKRGDRTRTGDGKGGDRQRRDRPRFDPPPELPQRPKPKRLRPGKARRNELLAEIPEEQRPIAELTLQGMSAVRSRLAEENAKLKAAGRPEMPEASVLKLAEDLLPKLRVADWLDRAEAAQRQMTNLDLRDLRSVVAASADPIVARDETAHPLAEQLKTALHDKQEEEQRLWLDDVTAALDVGRVIRALRLSSQPPKAGVMFPPQLARRLGEAATQSLQPDDSGDRWAAVMEAAAFSPVRTLVAPTAPPTRIGDDLKKTTRRLGPLLPQFATLLGVEVPADAPRPKPLRPPNRRDQKGRNQRPTRGGAPADRKPSDTKPRDAKTTNAKPRDAKTTDAKPRDAKTRDTKPSDTKPSDTKPSDDAKPSDTQHSDTKPSNDAKPSDDVKPSDAKPSDDVTSSDTKPSNDAKPSDDVTPSDTKPSNDAKLTDDVTPSDDGKLSDDAKPSDDVTSSDGKPSDDAKPTDDVTSSDDGKLSD